MAILTAGLTARAALSNLHKLDGPPLTAAFVLKEGVRRREERKKREEKDKEN